MVMSLRRRQAAFDQVHIGLNYGSLDELIRSAMYRCLRQDLGLPNSIAQDRAASEASGAGSKRLCDECESAGLSFRSKRVLDLGAGLGSLSVEIARRGASVIAVEPGEAWRTLTAKRLSGIGTTLAAVGEYLPLADNSVDLIVSMQVLEHVQKPADVIREAFRVLKPGGYILLRYENYLSFWEPHYRVPWLPLLPKPIGAAYLRLLGRSPQFLCESITYTTFPSVRRHFLSSGFECMRLKGYRENLCSPHKVNLKWRILKRIASVHESLGLRILATADCCRRMFSTAGEEFMQKPLSVCK